jgi:undecaprenyl-diphosphatase
MRSDPRLVMSWIPPPADDWNLRVFRLLHATDSSPSVLIPAARYLAEVPLIVALCLVVWQIVRGRDGVTAARLLVAAVCVFGVETIASAIQYHPRPFEAGFGPAWTEHPANSSMPSTHVTLAWMMAVTFALQKRWATSIALALLGSLMAWARICIGIHWPADMLGAAISGALSAVLGRSVQRGWMWLTGRISPRMPDRSSASNK